MQRHVEPPHLQSQKQTLSTPSRVEQARGAWGALSGGSPRGARGAGAEPSGAGGCGFESFGELPRSTGSNLPTTTKEGGHQSAFAQRILALIAPLRIAPQLRAQGHVEARRQKVIPLRGHAAKDHLAVRRDAAARRQRLAAGDAGAAEVLDPELIELDSGQR